MFNITKTSYQSMPQPTKHLTCTSNSITVQYQFRINFPSTLHPRHILLIPSKLVFTPYSLMLRALRRSSKYQSYSFFISQTGALSIALETSILAVRFTLTRPCISNNCIFIRIYMLIRALNIYLIIFFWYWDILIKNRFMWQLLILGTILSFFNFLVTNSSGWYNKPY